MSQARFDGIPEKIVAIDSSTTLSVSSAPPTSTTLVTATSTPKNHDSPASNHLMNIRTVIGIIVGIVSLFLLLIVIAVYCLRKKRRKMVKQSKAGIINPPATSQTPRTLVFSSIREIGENSVIGPIRELHGTDTAELQDQHSTSSPNSAMPEKTAPAPPALHELRTHRSSHEAIIRQSAVNRLSRILRSTHFSSANGVTNESPDLTPRVPTVISSSPQSDFPRDSLESSSTRSQIFASYMRTPLNLNRPLPPAPISESPVISPLTPRLTKDRFRRDIISNNRSVQQGSRSTSISPQRLVSRYSATNDASQFLARRDPSDVVKSGVAPTTLAGVSSKLPTLPKRSQSPTSYWI